jgi:ABC-type transport system involved in multi-copper enzyme maturation permease subunit
MNFLLQYISTIGFIVDYEFRRYLKTTRAYILLLTGTIPLIIALSLSAEKSRIEYLAIGRIDLIQLALLIGFIFYSYILLIFFSIIVLSDFVSNERSYEFLLINVSRTSLLVGKIITTLLLNISLLGITTISFLITLYSYNIPIPSFESLTKVFYILIFLITSVIIPIILLSNVIVIKLNLSSSMANYLAMFVFYVIPFIIYFAFFELTLFQTRMLDFSIHTIVQHITYFVIVTNSGISQDQFNNAVGFLVLISSICYIGSLILFSKSSIY